MRQVIISFHQQSKYYRDPKGYVAEARIIQEKPPVLVGRIGGDIYLRVYKQSLSMYYQFTLNFWKDISCQKLDKELSNCELVCENWSNIQKLKYLNTTQRIGLVYPEFLIIRGSTCLTLAPDEPHSWQLSPLT
jgi:hypothetical protein